MNKIAILITKFVKNEHKKSFYEQNLRKMNIKKGVSVLEIPFKNFQADLQTKVLNNKKPGPEKSDSGFCEFIEP